MEIVDHACLQVYSVIEKHQKHFLVRIQMQDSAQLQDKQLYLSW